jgi:hypothetical protein
VEVGQDNSHDGDAEEDKQAWDLVSSGYKRIAMARSPLLPRLRFNTRCFEQ